MSFDNIVKFIQVMALVVGGVWVFVRFLDHDREAAEIGVERDQIALELAEISLETTRRRSDLSEIEFAQTLALAELEIERLELQNRSAEVEFESSTGRSIDYSYHLNISDGRSVGADQLVEYNAEFRVEITNNSDVDLTVDAIVIDTFRFSGVDQYLSNNIINIVPIRPIPKFHLTDRDDWEDGTVDGWEFIGREIFLANFGSSSVLNFLTRHGLDLSSANASGPMLGIWRPGETTFFRRDYVIVGRPGDYVGFVATICFNECEVEGGVWNFPASEALPLLELATDLVR